MSRIEILEVDGSTIVTVGRYRGAVMHDDPSELRRVERDAVRVVVLDSANRVLLLHTRDLSNPEFGTLWELPGGGTEPGETYLEAAIRELREETGIRVEPTAVGQPTWRRDVEYTYRGERRLQHELVTAIRLDEAAPDVEGSQRVDFESEDLFGHRWWTVDEIASSDQRFYPRQLPTLLRLFLAGDEIAEPLERWPEDQGRS